MSGLSLPSAHERTTESSEPTHTSAGVAATTGATDWITVSEATDALRARYHLEVSRMRVQFAAKDYWVRLCALHPDLAHARTTTRQAVALSVAPTDREVRAVRMGTSESRSMFLVDAATLGTLWLNLPRSHPDYRPNPRGGRLHNAPAEAAHTVATATAGEQADGTAEVFTGHQRGGARVGGGRPVGSGAHGNDARLHFFGGLSGDGLSPVRATALSGAERRAAERMVARGLLAKTHVTDTRPHSGGRTLVAYVLTEAGQTRLTELAEMDAEMESLGSEESMQSMESMEASE